MTISNEVLGKFKEEAERVVQTRGDSWSPTYVKNRAQETLVLISELEELRAMKGRVDDYRNLMTFKYISVHGLLLREPGMDSLRKLTLELVEEHYKTVAESLEVVLRVAE